MQWVWQPVHWLDAALILGYLALIMAVGLLTSHRHSSAKEYFLASRRQGWASIGLSLFGSNISPGVLIGVTGSAYALGISVYNYDWIAALTLAVFAVLFLPIILSAGIYTTPEFLEQRYDWRIRVWFSVLTLFLYILLDGAGTIYCGLLVLHYLLPGLGDLEGIALMAVPVAIYTISGGLRSAMYTQAVQAVIVLASSLLLAVFAFAAAGGWHAVATALPRDQLSLIRPASDPYMPWTGLVFGAPIIAFYYWCTNQVMVQKMLAARSVEASQRGALFAGLLKLTTLFLIVLPGIAGRKLFPGLVHGDDIYLRLAFGLMPTGLLGLLLAALSGALMAQLSATYSSTATLIAVDFVHRFRPDLSDRLVVRAGRIATVLCMVASALWVPQIMRFPSLWQYFQAVLAYATPPVVVLFFGAILWPQGAKRAGMATAICGNAAGLILLLLSASGTFPISFLNAAPIIFLVSLAAMAAAGSWRGQWSLREVADAFRQTRKSVRLWATMLCAVALSLVAAFW